MRYSKIAVRFSTDSQTPYFIGSQIRGALGYALKGIVCINPTMRCDGCFAQENCLYHLWYERPGSYHPYRLDYRLGMGYYDFSLYLFEEATERLPFVLSAILKMLTHHGLGKERRRIERYELFLNGQSIYDGHDGHAIRLPDNRTLSYDPLPKEAPHRVRVRFVTPLRIKYRNRFVRDIKHLPLPTLIDSIWRRSRQLMGEDESSRQKLPFRVEGVIVDAFGEFRDLSRYSGRQKGHLKIGGLLGEIAIEGIDEQSYRLLQLARLIGAGKQTVFGLGKIELDEMDTI